MTRRRGNKTKEKIKLKGGEIPPSSYTFSVNLQPPQQDKDKYFLGFKTKNINQLWDWNTLEDIIF